MEVFEKKITISGRPYVLRASALFKVKYTFYFDKKVEIVLQEALKEMSKIQNFHINNEEDYNKLNENSQLEYLDLSQDLANKACEIAWVMAKCGDKEFNLDYESFINEINDYDWVGEVLALAGNTFCNWNITL